MLVNELFLSIQGESLTAGFPTVFVRFTGCNLRCNYCDTTYAYDEGQKMSPEAIYEKICEYTYERVCLTGGEPLLQKELNLLLRLLDDYVVSIETNGSLPLQAIKLGSKHTFVMDIKTPSSGEAQQMHWPNLALLTARDEIKFVIGTRTDYEWVCQILRQYHPKATISFSVVFGQLDYQEVVQWLLADRLEVRFQVQLHKIIWGREERGV